MLESTGLTDVGIQRKNNEDHILVDRIEHLFVLCDGMGGHAGGEVASKMGCDTVAGFIQASRRGGVPQLPYPWDPNLPPEANRLSMAIRLACYTIWQAARQTQGLADMGTTVAALLVHDRVAYIAHVGDSRIYRWRDAKLEPLTRDHSEVNDLIDAGHLHPQEALRHPDKNVITRALGVEPDVQATLAWDRSKEGDVFLLCSDGLSDLISDRKLAEMLAEGLVAPDGKRPTRSQLDTLAKEMIKQANGKGGVDNISVILVRQHA